LDFAAEKKGGRPSRPCGNWSTCSHPAHWNRGERQRTQAGRLFPFSKIQKQAAFGITYNALTLLYEKFIIFPKAFYLTAEHGGTACEKDEFTLQFQARLRPSLMAPIIPFYFPILPLPC